MRLSLMDVLLLSSFLAAVPFMPAASADDAPAPVQGQKRAAKAAAKDVQTETISIIGQGSTRQIQVLDAAQLSQAAPGTNPLKVVGQLPGVSFNSTDPLALDPYSANVYMRGFTEDQLGFTLDGIPLGAQGYGSSGQGYGNIGGININSAIIADNIGRVNVSQGAGGVDVASASNLGGVMQFFSVDPPEKPGGTISQGFGSFNTERTFVRLDSGVLNPTGTRLFVSYARSDEDKWKGGGGMFQQQVNAKLVQPLGDKGTLSAFFDWDDEAEATYSDLSKDILGKLGPDVDYYYPNYAAAYRAAQGIYPPGYSRLVDPLDASYYDGPSKAVNYLAGVKLDINLSDALEWKTTLYGHGKDFAGYYTSPYYPSPNGAPLSEEEFASVSQRAGVTTDLVYRVAGHTIDAGLWYEHMHAYVPENLYQEPVLGQGTPLNPLGTLPPPYATPWAYGYSDNTVQTHLQDTFQLLPAVRVNLGFPLAFLHGHQLDFEERCCLFWFRRSSIWRNQCEWCVPAPIQPKLALRVASGGVLRFLQETCVRSPKAVWRKARPGAYQHRPPSPPCKSSSSRNRISSMSLATVTHGAGDWAVDGLPRRFLEPAAGDCGWAHLRIFKLRSPMSVMCP